MHPSTSSSMSLPRLPTKILDISELWESHSAKIQKEITTILNYNSQLRLIFLPHALTAVRAGPLRWLEWWIYCRCLRNHLKCHFLQIELSNRFLHMLQQSIKVSLIAVSVEQWIYLLLARCWPLPILLVTRVARGRALSTYLMGGSQTVLRYQHSRTCCVQCSPTHQILAHLSVSLASSLTMTTPDQKKSHADYIQLSMQAQFNKRAL